MDNLFLYTFMINSVFYPAAVFRFQGFDGVLSRFGEFLLMPGCGVRGRKTLYFQRLQEKKSLFAVFAVYSA